MLTEQPVVLRYDIFIYNHQMQIFLKKYRNVNSHFCSPRDDERYRDVIRDRGTKHQRQQHPAKATQTSTLRQRVSGERVWRVREAAACVNTASQRRIHQGKRQPPLLPTPAEERSPDNSALQVPCIPGTFILPTEIKLFTTMAFIKQVNCRGKRAS